MVQKVVSLEEAIYAVIATCSAVWHAIVGYRYMWDMVTGRWSSVHCATSISGGSS